MRILFNIMMTYILIVHILPGLLGAIVGVIDDKEGKS